MSHVGLFRFFQEHGLENISGQNNLFSKQLQAVDYDLKEENRARDIKEDKDKDSEEGELEAKKKANQLKDDIALVISIFIILVLTASIVFGKVKYSTNARHQKIEHNNFQIYFFTPAIDLNISTFKPIIQSKNSAMKYSGPGFLPCNGFQPCQVSARTTRLYVKCFM